MAKYIYGNTITAHTTAKSNDVITEFQAIQTMSIAEEIRTDDAIKLPAGEGNDIRIVENAAQRAGKILGFDGSGDLDVLVAFDFDAAVSGHFTPFVYGTSTPGSPVLSIAQGDYLVVSDWVFFHLWITLTSKGGMAGSVAVGGLPFDINTLNNVGKCDFNLGLCYPLTMPGPYHVFANGIINDNAFILTHYDLTSGASNITGISPTNFADNTQFTVSGKYKK